MEALLSYLDALDDGVGIAVAGVSKIEGGIGLKISRRDDEILDLSHSYVDRNVAVHPRDGKGTIGRVVEDMGPNNHVEATVAELDLAMPRDRGTQQ